MPTSATHDVDTDPEARAPGVSSVASFSVGGVRFAVLSIQLHDCSALGDLTDAERQVAALVARGLSNFEIARHRSTSNRTVANQMAAIIRKVGVGSRYALAARLALCPLSAEEP